MKKTITVIFILCMNIIHCSAQNSRTFLFEYDNMGNRVVRYMTPPPSMMSESNQNQDNKTNADSTNIKKLTTDGIYSLKIYPNPTKGNININVEKYKRGSKIIFKLYDVNNRLMYNLESSNAYTAIDISSLSVGVYYLKVVIENSCNNYMIIKE